MGRHSAPAPFDAAPTTGPVSVVPPTTGPVRVVPPITGPVGVVPPTTDPRLFDAPLPARTAAAPRPAQARPTAAPARTAPSASPTPPPVPAVRRGAARDGVPAAPVPNAPIGYAASASVRDHVAPSPALAPATAVLPVFGDAPRPAVRQLPAPAPVAPRLGAASLHTGPVQIPAFEVEYDPIDEEQEEPSSFLRSRTVKLAACAVAVLGAVSGAALLMPGQTSSASATETQGCHPSRGMPRPQPYLTAEQRRAMKKYHHVRRTAAPAVVSTATAGSTPSGTPTTKPSATASASATTAPSTSPSSSGSASPIAAPVPSTGSGEYTGGDLGSLPGVVSSAIRNVVSGASGAVDLVNGTYSFSGFDQYLLGVNLKGKDMVGEGINKSVIRMAPHTSDKAGRVPTAKGTTNQLYMLQAVGTKKLSDFSLIGTEQGHLYNGIRLGQTSDFRGSNIRVVGVPGNDHLPPGETFGINDWRTTNSVWSNIEVDGGGVGAAGFGANSSNDITVRNSYFHNNPASLGATFWQTHNVTVVDTTSSGNRGGLNFERVSGTVNIVRPVLKNNSSSDISVGSDRESAKITITDPVLEPGKKLRIRLFNGYGAGPNKQQKSDIHVIVDGVDRTASMVQWL